MLGRAETSTQRSGGGRRRRAAAKGCSGELEAGRAEEAEQLVFALQIVQRAVRRAPNIPRAMQKFPARWMDFTACWLLQRLLEMLRALN